MSKLFSRTKIFKASSSIFKGGAEEKKEIAKSSRYGFSETQMHKKLKDDYGYDSSRREKIMNSMLGVAKQKPQKLSLDELAKMKRKDEKAKNLRIFLGKESSEDYKQKKGGWYDKLQSSRFAGKESSPEGSRGFAQGSKNNSLGINMDKNNSLGIKTGERPKFGGVNN